MDYFKEFGKLKERLKLIGIVDDSIYMSDEYKLGQIGLMRQLGTETSFVKVESVFFMAIAGMPDERVKKFYGNIEAEHRHIVQNYVLSYSFMRQSGELNQNELTAFCLDFAKHAFAMGAMDKKGLVIVDTEDCERNYKKMAEDLFNTFLRLKL